MKRTCPKCGKEFEASILSRQRLCDGCKGAITRTCQYCGGTFKTRRHVKYCSDECKSHALKEVHAKKPRACLNCGKEVRQGERFCSTDCRISFEFRSIKRPNTQTAREIAERSEKHRATLSGRELNYWLIGGFNEGVKRMVRERDGNRCYICGAETNLHVHHIVPRAQGGPNIPENLVTLCSSCHRSVESGNVERAIKKCVERAVNNANL